MESLGNKVRDPVLYLCNPPKINGADLNGDVTGTVGHGCMEVSLKNLRSRTRVHNRHHACVKTVPNHVIGGVLGTNDDGPIFVLSRVSGISTGGRRNSPTSTLLRMLSPRRGGAFRSGCLSISCSLSGILFVTATGSVDSVPHPLLSQVRLVRMNNCVARRGVRVTGHRLVPGRLRGANLSGFAPGMDFGGTTVRNVVRRCAQRDNIHRLGGRVGGKLHGVTCGLTCSGRLRGPSVATTSLGRVLNATPFAHSVCRNGSCTKMMAKLT